MITENLSTLKIHKLTQAQYDRELSAGNIDENALYLTPDEEITAEKIGAAPAGYGLGELASAGVTDCNELMKNGWYTTTANALNRPVWSSDEEYECAILVIGNGTFIQQIGIMAIQGGHVVPRIRGFQNGEWTSWTDIVTSNNADGLILLDLYNHVDNTENPHGVTIEQLVDLETEVTDIVISGIMNNTEEGYYGPIRETLQSVIADETENGGPIGEAIWNQTANYHEEQFYSDMEIYGFLTNDEEEGYIPNVYTKAEVDTQVGNIETELKAYIEETILGGAW